MEKVKSFPGFQRIPRHIGIIPDGNRRWAERNGYPKEAGYAYGIDPGFELYRHCLELGVKEMTFYGFTQDNTKRPLAQRLAFQRACVEAVMRLANHDADLLVVGNTDSPMFPKELLPFTKRVKFGQGLMRINFLVNYSWQWDIGKALQQVHKGMPLKNALVKHLGSAEISRIDLLIRWGNRRRLSGFLPVQTVYADFYVVEELWPDYEAEHLFQALRWYEEQDITLGG